MFYILLFPPSFRILKVPQIQYIKMASKSWIKSQPGKFIWTLWALTFNAMRLPFWMIYFMPQFLRQNPKWTYSQALRVRILQEFLKNVWLMEVRTPTELKAGKEGDKFVIIHPAKAEKYIGTVAQDFEVRPETIGGTWFPNRPVTASAAGDVVLHFHGGAYVIGDGRIDDAGFAAKTMIENTPATHVFCPQYRLASNPGGRFPAPLQDAITSLLYLTENLRIPANKITISGDSAGGHLCLALLRYIADNPDAKLPNPHCAWLWSPWVDPQGSLIEGYFERSSNASTDYLTDGFGAWGARALAPSEATKLTLAHPNLTFLGTAFATPTPLFFSVGECEMLFNDDVKAYQEFKAIPGNKVELQIESKAVHDIILVGAIVGFQKEATIAAKRAGEFLKGCK
jgi:acetyl esterase/lipase